ncbi:MAG TPA: DUF47 family protein [Pyrodictium delaneyi]|uniref:DUF47 family protein n=1 Tax=Pyrodictium delaneyi TaxID=1273541 RepID=A0A833E9J7_9CREN|nr:DUF47 family protein [Pyrodictium delaneyi]
MAEEYYDYDMERRRRQSLAEESLNEQLLGITRALSETVVSMKEIVSALTSADDKKLKEIHRRIKESKERVESMKEDALTYLARLGDLLNTSTLYKDVFLGLTHIAQMTEGIAYRSYLLASNTNITSATIAELLTSIAESIQKEFERLEVAIQALSSSPKKGYEEAQLVTGIEDEVDNLYRQLTFAMYRELRQDLVALMLLRDIVDMIEDVADTIRDAAENVKFLALYRVARH